MTDQAHNKPVKTFKAGPVRASIFENKAEGGESFFSFSLSRSYKAGEEWKTSTSFSTKHLEDFAAVFFLARTFIEAEEAKKAA